MTIEERFERLEQVVKDLADQFASHTHDKQREATVIPYDSYVNVYKKFDEDTE